MRATALALLFLASAAFAHVGSPDVYYEGDAGAYHLLVTVRPPAMIPGVAAVEIRATSGSPSAVQLVPVYVTGKDAGLPPTPDQMQAVPGDPQSFRGNVWLMASGSWEVRAQVDGAPRQGRTGRPRGRVRSPDLAGVRWQIELVFKRLKSLAQLGHVPKHDDRSSRAWLYGKLLVTLLAQKLIRVGREISPSGWPVLRREAI